METLGWAIVDWVKYLFNTVWFTTTCNPMVPPLIDEDESPMTHSQILYAATTPPKIELKPKQFPLMTSDDDSTWVRITR